MKNLIMLSVVVLLLFSLVGCGNCKHEYDEGLITKEATCTETGEKTFTCLLCKKTKTEIVEKKRAHL